MRVFKSLPLVLMLLTGSLFAQGPFGSKKKETPPPTPQNVTAKVQVPSLTPMAESNPSQTKGGLRITLTPLGYAAEQMTSDTARQVPPPSHFGLIMKPDPRAIYVEHTQTTQLVVKPDRMVIKVHVNNDLSRVFRGAGIAVQFNVAGKVSNVDPSGYGDLVNLLIPPRGEQEVTIVGPKIENIPSPCTIGIFLYDVVTKMDDAGNIVEKTNFEWYFSYQTQDTQKEIPGPVTTAGWVMPR